MRRIVAKITDSKYRSKRKGEARNTPRVNLHLRLPLSRFPLKNEDAYIS